MSTLTASPLPAHGTSRSKLWRDLLGRRLPLSRALARLETVVHPGSHDALPLTSGPGEADRYVTVVRPGLTEA